MNRSASILVVAALFLSGVAIGALGMHLYYWQKLGARGPGGPMPHGPMMIGWMERELDLSPDQREAIREILADSVRRSGELRHEMRPRIEGLMRETSERIAEVLTTEQRRRYEELRSRQRQRFDSGFLGPPGGPRRPGAGPWRHRTGPPPPSSPEDP